MYQPFQIVWAEAAWRHCPDERPWLLIDVRRNGEAYGALPISTKLYLPSGGYTILSVDHPDFSATGLRERSYVYYESTIDIGDDEIRRELGWLTGDLLEHLKVAAGL